MSQRPRSSLGHLIRQWFLLIFLLGGFAAMIGYARLGEAWERKGKIEPRGGRYFFHRVEIDVPLFRQGDERWGADPLGPTAATLAQEGCAVSSAAMVLASYGFDVDPKRLNQFLNEHGGFSSRGWLSWESAAEYSPGKVRKAYEDLPSYDLIDENIEHGNPVIVRLRTPHGITHFVVIAGKQGYDYLTRDPIAKPGKELYPLREFGSKIEALRFYQKL